MYPFDDEATEAMCCDDHWRFGVLGSLASVFCFAVALRNTHFGVASDIFELLKQNLAGLINVRQ